MESCSQSVEQIRGRLLKLEKQNRQFKQLGAAALIVAASLLVMGQSSLKKTVEANEFILKDSSGNIRARLSMGTPFGAAPEYPPYPRLVFYDKKGKQTADLNGDSSMPGLDLYDDQGQPRIAIMFDSAFGGGLLMRDEHGTLRTRLKEGEVLATEFDGGHVDILDADGFEAILGTADLLTSSTGEKHKTSAASLILFDKNKHVIWKAP